MLRQEIIHSSDQGNTALEMVRASVVPDSRLRPGETESADGGVSTFLGLQHRGVGVTSDERDHKCLKVVSV